MIEAITITSTQDRGVPNAERIVLRVNENCDLGHYWIGLGIKLGINQISPLNDNLYWLGRGHAKQGDWIYLYTGMGVPQSNPLPNLNNNIFTMHWNRSNILFGIDGVFPYLIGAPLVGLPEDFEQPSIGSLLSSNGQQA